MTQSHTLCRRQFVGTAGMASLGLGLLPALPHSVCAASPPTPSRPIRACILLFYYGGPSQLDTLDPKPEAPAEVRGEYRSIATSVPGIRLCEHLQRTAHLMDRVAL